MTKPNEDVASPLSPSRLLAPAEVARLLGISASTLAVWRCRRRYGLTYVKVGSRVMYSQQAVEDFIRARGRGTGTED